MNPEAQRIAIAKACGWKAHSIELANSMWFRPHETCKALERTTRIPDYLNDLNAMREVVLTLRSNREIAGGMMKYGEILGAITGGWFDCLTATAEQQAEAFLKVKGKWEEL